MRGSIRQYFGILAQDILAAARLVRLARARRWRGYVQRPDGIVRVLTLVCSLEVFLSEICARVFLPTPTPTGTLRSIAEHNGVSRDGHIDSSYGCYGYYAHYYVGPIDSAEAFVREAKRAGFDALPLMG